MDKTVEIVILAMVAAFLGLRLYSVLGRRAEHEEQPRLEPKLDAPRMPAPDLPDRGGTGVPPRVLVPGVTPAIERALKELALADKRFDLLALSTVPKLLTGWCSKRSGAATVRRWPNCAMPMCWQLLWRQSMPAKPLVTS